MIENSAVLCVFNSACLCVKKFFDAETRRVEDAEYRRGKAIFEKVSNITKRLYVVTLLIILATLIACGSRTTNRNTTRDNLIVVNAPAAGTVRRVIAREGLPVREGATLLEIAIETPIAVTNQNDSMTEAAERARQIAQAQTRVSAATRSKERTAVEVARVEALVAAGLAPQSQLDAARAEYQRAQEQAQAPPIAVLTPTTRPTIAPDTEARIVVVRVPASGTMRVISVKTGDRVSANQPLATLTVED